MSKIKISYLSILLILLLSIIGCSSSNYVNVNVKKSAFLPDTAELNRDSLITGAIRICKMGQRYYNKPMVKGGGENSFIGFTIPSHLHTTDFGTYIMKTKGQTIEVTGIGYLPGVNKREYMKVKFIAAPDAIISTIIIN